MKPNNPTHAAGHAAYTRNSPRQNGAASSAEKPSESGPSSGPEESRLQNTDEEGLTAQEQKMIEQNFPEDPELSMRLYGRGRDAETVRGRAIGDNIDVTG